MNKNSLRDIMWGSLHIQTLFACVWRHATVLFNVHDLSSCSCKQQWKVSRTWIICNSQNNWFYIHISVVLEKKAAIGCTDVQCEFFKLQYFPVRHREGDSKVCQLHSDWPNVFPDCKTDLLICSQEQVLMEAYEERRQGACHLLYWQSWTDRTWWLQVPL